MSNLNTYIRDNFHGTPTGWNTWWDEQFNYDYYSWQWPSSSGNYVVYDNEEEDDQILTPKDSILSGDFIIEWELYTLDWFYDAEGYGLFLMSASDQEIARIRTRYQLDEIEGDVSTVKWNHSGSTQDTEPVTFIEESKYKYKIERVNGVITGYYETSYEAGWTAFDNPIANNFEDFYVKIECGYWQNFNYFDFKAESGLPYLTHPNQVSRTEVAREGDILMGL